MPPRFLFREAYKKANNWLRRVAKWFANLIHWLWATRLVATALFAPVLLFVVVSVVLPCLERQIRLSGMLVQILGLLTVALGLRDTRLAFDDQPSTWASVKGWWKRRPRFTPQPRIIAAGAVSSGSSRVSGRGRVSPGPQTSLDHRVALLEEQYASLFDEVGTLGNEFKSKAEELSRDLEAESREREKGDNKNREQLKKAVAEGRYLALVGVLFFVLGTIAGSASPEIASVFGAGSCSYDK